MEGERSANSDGSGMVIEVDPAGRPAAARDALNFDVFDRMLGGGSVLELGVAC